MDALSNPKAMCRLLSAAEKSKQILSTIPSTDMTVECLMNDNDVSINVSRASFESSCSKLLDSMAEHINKVIQTAGKKSCNINSNN